jgi:multiple antibiotic resistance protein
MPLLAGDTVIPSVVETAFTSLVTFLVILDPPGAAVMFIALTRTMSLPKQRATAWMGVILAGAILMLFALTGRMWLAAIGIGLPAFQIAGGLLLFMLATQMVLGRQSSAATVDTEEQEDITVFPLAFPLIAGPGSMAAVILLMGRAQGDTAQGAVVIAMLLAALAIVLVSLLQAGLIVRVLKITGCDVVARIMAINLAALAVQFIVNGTHDILLQWHLLK